MKTIIVPIDFSPASINAANYATDMAKAVDAEILLMHVFYLLINYNEVPQIADPGLMRSDAEDQLYDLKRSIRRKTGNAIKIRSEVRMGNFFVELKSLCEEVIPYAVVMGSQGETASDYRLFGSHSVYAMKHLRWPLVTVPRGTKFSTIRKIGLACDFKEDLEKASIDEIKTLVHDFGAELHVLNTSSEKEHNPELVFDSGLLMGMLSPVPHEYHFMNSNNTDESIIDFCELNNIDLLIVMPKRHSLFEKIVHRSHTKQFVLHSHIPVMALHF